MNLMRRAVRAFTLIEMLTVIAIIGILAGILIPTVQVAMKKARIVTASADVSNLSQAATAYNLDFGAFPPDQRPANPSDTVPANQDPFPANLNPNECLMWYLSMQYANGSSTTQTATGYPANWSCPPGNDVAGDWTPASATAVFSRVNAGPYFDMKAKQKKSWTFDSQGNAYYDFVDPWGRPYMYRAYPLSASASAVVSGNTVTVTLSNPACVWNLAPTTPSPASPAGPPWPVNTPGYNYFNANLNGTYGSIQLTGFSVPALNGTFTIQSSSGSTVTFTLSPGPGNGTYSGTYSFRLHNPQTCDIYSLGPYGVTRAASMPYRGEWKPVDASSLSSWVLVWGTPGDGNDVNSPSGNIITNSQYQDNICNW
jgi:prepilin-type N-terminal cleavage/methylation domain-containing protein